MNLKQEKGEFHKDEVRYLGMKIRRGGVKIDSAKVVAIQDRLVPQSTFDVRSFIGFANFYRHFIRNFSGMVRPLMALTGRVSSSSHQRSVSGRLRRSKRYW